MTILDSEPPRRDEWARTRWSVVSNLGVERDAAWESSWEHLADTYRDPMERYVRRVLARSLQRSVPREEVSEVVQAFLAICIEKGWLARADRAQGRFRAYLQSLLRRYTYRVLKHRAAKRRRPADGAQVFALEPDEDLAAPTPDEQADLDDFSRTWVQIAVDRVLARLAEGDAPRRDRTVVLDLILTDGEGSADIAERVGVRPAQLPVVKHRARQRFCKLFEEELAQTVGDQEAFEEEWRAIRPFLPKGV